METLDAVLDVGGVYDPSSDCYDHHQKGFEEVFGHGFNTKLSSAGLVYKVTILTSPLVLDLNSCGRFCFIFQILWVIYSDLLSNP